MKCRKAVAETNSKRPVCTLSGCYCHHTEWSGGCYVQTDEAKECPKFESVDMKASICKECLYSQPSCPASVEDMTFGCVEDVTFECGAGMDNVVDCHQFTLKREV